MAKTRAPLLAFGASGQIGKTQVYATWRGVPYARQLVKPANPQTAGQVSTRNVFRDLTQLWKLAPSLAQTPWTANAAGRPYTNRNKFLSSNIALLREAADFTDFVGSPGAKGGPAASAIAGSVTGSDVTITLTAPELPTGWTINMGVAWLIPDVDPQTQTSFTSFAASANASPYAIAINNVGSGKWLATGWFEYQVNPTTKAYGPSLSTSVTVA